MLRTTLSVVLEAAESVWSALLRARRELKKSFGKHIHEDDSMSVDFCQIKSIV